MQVSKRKNLKHSTDFDIKKSHEGEGVDFIQLILG